MENHNNYPWKVKWTKRNNIIGKLIKQGESVLDIGGGLGELKKFIKPSNYVSFDVKKWNDDTIVTDLNETFPKLNIKFDVMVCQGILEYIKNPLFFLSGIREYSNRLILTYRSGDGKGYPMDRLNNYNIRDVLFVLECTEWTVVEIKDSIVKSEVIYICEHGK